LGRFAPLFPLLRDGRYCTMIDLEITEGVAFIT